jgi:hypothetical protein
MTLPAFLRRLSPSMITILVAAMLLAFSARLLSLQAQAIRDIAVSGVPVLQRLPRADERRRILAQQLEIAEVEQAMRGGTHDDLVRAYVLPSDAALDRLLSALDVVLTSLDAADRAPITVAADAAAPVHGLSAQTVRLEASLTPAHVDDLLSFLSLTGDVSVGDALTPAQRGSLLRATEQESPASLTAVEAFLATDLLRYARDPKAAEEQLRRSFADPAFPRLLDMLVRDSVLDDAQRLLSGPLGTALHDANLWPTRFLTVQEASMDKRADGKVLLTLELKAWGR